MTEFAALTGFYRLLFLYLEPLSTTIPALMLWLYPGASWFHNQLIPDGTPVPPASFLDQRSVMAVWQLGNCYLLLGMLEGLGLRAVRDALPNDPVAQERIAGTTLLAMAIADLLIPLALRFSWRTMMGLTCSQVTHIAATWFALPKDLQYAPLSWNGTTHGNITVVVFLFASRLAWFAGVGRKRYYYGQTRGSPKGKSQ